MDDPLAWLTACPLLASRDPRWSKRALTATSSRNSSERSTVSPLPELDPLARLRLSIDDWHPSSSPGHVNPGPHSYGKFNGLPVELIAMIRSFIPTQCLLTHLAFAWSCRAVARVYQNDERFWKKACLAFGIGRPLGGVISWQRLALGYLKEVLRNCQIPDYGEEAIWIDRHNWRVVEMARRPHESIYSPLVTQDLLQTTKIKGFSATLRLHGDEYCARKGCPYEGFTHPSAFIKDRGHNVCAFATDMPLEQINLKILDLYTIEVSNPDGVTTWDVISQLQSEMENRQLTLLDLDMILAHGDTEAGRRFRYLFWIPYSYFISLAFDAHEVSPREKCWSLLRTLGTIKLPALFSLEDQVLVLRILSPYVKISDMLAIIKAHNPAAVEHFWFSQFSRFQTLASTISTLHGVFHGIKHTGPKPIEFSTQWKFPDPPWVPTMNR